MFRQQLHPFRSLPISPFQVLACLWLSLSQEAEIQDEVLLQSAQPSIRFSPTLKSSARIVLIHIIAAGNCRHSVFSFSWAGHSGRLVPSPQCKCSHSFF
jgi:hypothetical protein